MTRIHESGTEDVNGSATTDQRRFKCKRGELTGRVSDGADSFPVLVIDISDAGAKIQVDGVRPAPQDSPLRYRASVIFTPV